ncbi:MAG TPA: LUD domain-containing protein [Sphingomonas sp.]|nr:LUD domain-containing protein [Sphingomonas sp.]
MTARDAILAKLGPTRPIATLAAEADALIGTVERPAIPDGTVAAFLAQLAQPSVSATHDAIATLAELPAAVARYLDANAGTRAVYLPPDPRLAALDWQDLDLLDACPVDDGAVVALARAGVAETGSLIFETAPTAPMLPNFRALHHLVVLDRASIVPHLEDALLPPGPQPRAHYWVTGVSGTTDIEGQYVRGAHGPRFLHVVLVG